MECVGEAPDNYYHLRHEFSLIKQGAAGLYTGSRGSPYSKLHAKKLALFCIHIIVTLPFKHKHR